MKNWDRLPSEILSTIFRNLDDKDNQNCSLTCRWWRLPAQDVLFETLPSMTDEKMKALINALSVYQDSEKHSPGNFVKSLTTVGLSNNMNVELLNKVFPKLELINTGDNTDDQKPLHLELYGLLEVGSFPYLKRIPSVNLHEAHLNLTLARNQRMKEIRLYDDSSIESKVGEILHSLDFFPKLEVLELRFDNTSVAICLEDLLLNVHTPIKTLDFKFQSPANLILNVSPEEIDRVQPLPSLKRVNISSSQLLSGGDEALWYLMKKFPDVNSLLVQHDTDWISDLIEYKSSTTACIFQLLVYLFKMKGESLVGPIITNSVTNDIVKLFFKYALGEESSSLNDVELELEVVLDELLMEEGPERSLIPSSFIVAHNFERDLRKHCLIKVVYKLVDKDFEEYFELFKRVKHMDIATISVDSMCDYEALPSMKLNLDTILNCFTGFRRFKFSHFASVSSITMNWEVQDSKMESLEFNHCILTPEVINTLSVKFPSLKSLKFCECGFQESLVDMYWEDPLRISVIMQFTRLETLTFSFKNFFPICNVALKLVTANKKPRYCRILAKQFIDGFDKDDYASLLATERSDFISFARGGQESSLQEAVNSVYDIYFEQVKKLIVELRTFDNNQNKVQKVVRVYMEEDL